MNDLRTYRALRRAFPTWASVMRASPNDLKDVLRPAGLVEKRVRELTGILRQVKEDFGSYTLDPLKSWSDEGTEDYLASLPGIGRKSAQCVMM